MLYALENTSGHKTNVEMQRLNIHFEKQMNIQIIHYPVIVIDRAKSSCLSTDIKSESAVKDPRAISHAFISNKEKIAVIILLWIYLLSLSQPHAVFREPSNHSQSLGYILNCQWSLHSSRAAQSSSMFGHHICFFHLSRIYSNIRLLSKQLIDWQKSQFVSALVAIIKYGTQP